MSSILDALKKAENESVVDDGRGTPWTALPVDSSVDGQRRGRLWIPLGAVAVFCLIFSVFWLTRRPEPGRPAVVVNRASEPVAAEKTRSFAPATPDTQAVAPPAPETQPSTSHTVADVRMSIPSVPSPQEKTVAAVTPASPSQHPPPPQRIPKPEKTPYARPEPVPPPPLASTPPPVETASVPRPSEDAQQDGQKLFRSDARVDLQALVWAPEAADRFVVINNLLLREGGIIDKITVVKINQDDVLLSEGADRWYQEFKIR